MCWKFVDALGSRFLPQNSPHCETEYKQAVVQQWLSLLLFAWNAQSVLCMSSYKSWNVEMTNPLPGHCVVFAELCCISFPSSPVPPVFQQQCLQRRGGIRSSQTACGFCAGHLIEAVKDAFGAHSGAVARCFNTVGCLFSSSHLSLCRAEAYTSFRRVSICVSECWPFVYVLKLSHELYLFFFFAE